MKGIKVTEIGKEVKFKRVWGKLEPEKGFERPSVTKYLRLTLVFMWISALWKGLISVLQEFFASINIWQGDWALGYHFLGFWHSPLVS